MWEGYGIFCKEQIFARYPSCPPLVNLLAFIFSNRAFSMGYSQFK
jgi:hypothetical protein